MSEEISYYWQVDNFFGDKNHLRERLVAVQWSPAEPDETKPETTKGSIEFRIERVANSLTPHLFRSNVSGNPFPRMILWKKVESDGEVLNDVEMVVSNAIIGTMKQRDLVAGENPWADNLGWYVDELAFTCVNVEFPEVRSEVQP
ncbi:MAG: hypothetical protein ABI999_10005 [Acidobacteriota bacterium]